MKKFVTLVLMIFAFVTQYPKGDIMSKIQEECSSKVNCEQWKIFYWQSDPQNSKSSISWLKAHLYLALIIVFITGIAIITEEEDNKVLNICRDIVYFIFVTMIIKNVSNFGETNSYIATMVNSGLLLSAVYTKNRYFLNFMVFMLVIFFEYGYMMYKISTNWYIIYSVKTILGYF